MARVHQRFEPGDHVMIDFYPLDGEREYASGTIKMMEDHFVVIQTTEGIVRVRRDMMQRALTHNPGRPHTWIAKALSGHPSRKGVLRRALGMPQGKRLPLGKLRRAAKRSGTLGQHARLALRLRKYAFKKRRR